MGTKGSAHATGTGSNTGVPAAPPWPFRDFTPQVSRHTCILQVRCSLAVDERRREMVLATKTLVALRGRALALVAFKDTVDRDRGFHTRNLFCAPLKA